MAVLVIATLPNLDLPNQFGIIYPNPAGSTHPSPAGGAAILLQALAQIQH